MSDPSTPDASAQLRFLQDIQRVLDEGQFVSSYKYALLLTLAELCVEREPATDGTLRLSLGDISSRFIELYWRQVAPFRGAGILRQNIGAQAAIIRRIAEVREGTGSLAEFQRKAHWAPLVAEVRTLIVTMPLWKLQTVGRTKHLFLYSESIDNDAIVLEPGVAHSFRSLNGIVIALVQLAWIRYLHRVPANKSLIGPASDLADFLFGVERNALADLNEPLRDLQHGTCFYCQRPLSQRSEVDHFIPWSRYPRDLGHNFVLTHAACNAAKSSMLADTSHLGRWIERNDRYSSSLAKLFDYSRIAHDTFTTRQVATWAYESIASSGGSVWVEGKTIRPLPSDWRRMFM